MTVECRYLEGISFLVVDDNSFVRTLVGRVLRTFGARAVSEASDGVDALDIMRDFKPDILIIDWEMQPLDGIELTRMVRTGQDSPDPFMPIIMLSGHSERYRVMAARDAGVTEFVIKPVSAQALFSRIQAVIERPRRFVRTAVYFGPDRRRTKTAYSGPERRNAESEEDSIVQNPHQDMGQDEVDIIFNPDSGR
ncbi:MAG: response regulator [Rhodobacterales bacterium]|nr:response regulator [Rhodobacterales bacterium]